ncbi:hypothetical protein AAFF_G00249670 [Aldrovandia affinis]|uniref:HAT C-terminal dimerisation domain-containing protein n=1 Tax=Aldrovandia affinis TaxID=143900 RepID=A0AAD7W3Y8_9TELE|nr:hypothetical protein AAFF_G00249670 [Aldrovandia affinis]
MYADTQALKPLWCTSGAVLLGQKQAALTVKQGGWVGGRTASRWGQQPWRWCGAWRRSGIGLNFESLPRLQLVFPFASPTDSGGSRSMETKLSQVAGNAERAIEKKITLFSSPFSVDPDDAPDHLQLELIELQCDAECRSRHQQLPLVNFYRQLDKGRFQEIRTFAKKMLSLFGSTYLCEKTFSVMNINKNRLRTRLSDSHLHDILRIKTTVFEPDLAYLLQSRSQYHPSH